MCAHSYPDLQNKWRVSTEVTGHSSEPGRSKVSECLDGTFFSGICDVSGIDLTTGIVVEDESKRQTLETSNDGHPECSLSSQWHQFLTPDLKTPVFPSRSEFVSWLHRAFFLLVNEMSLVSHVIIHITRFFVSGTEHRSGTTFVYKKYASSCLVFWMESKI